MIVLEGKYFDYFQDIYINLLLADPNNEVKKLLIASIHHIIHLIGVNLMT